MRYLIASLMILTTLSVARAGEVKFCFLFCAFEQSAPMDSFCQSYQRVNQRPADGVEIERLSRGLKARLTANDVLYLCKCKAWDNPICSR